MSPSGFTAPPSASGCHRSDLAPIRSAPVPVGEQDQPGLLGGEAREPLWPSSDGRPVALRPAAADRRPAGCGARDDVKMIVVTAGANDVGFGELVAGCALDWARSSERRPDALPRHAQVEIEAALPGDGARTATGARRVRGAMRAPPATCRPDYRLVVMGYASPLPAGRWIRYPEPGWSRLNRGGCPIWDADADWAAGPGKSTRSMPRCGGRPAAAGAEFLDVRHALDGHQLCDRRSSRVGPAGPSPGDLRMGPPPRLRPGFLARIAASQRLRPACPRCLHRPPLREPSRRLCLPRRARPQLPRRDANRRAGVVSWSILMAMKRLRISAGGQVSVPAAVRQSWKTKVVVAEDRGDHLILRPAPEDPIEAARGAFAHLPGPTVDEARRLDREEEAEIEEEKFRAEGGS